jgi:hypothetical protein
MTEKIKWKATHTDTYGYSVMVVPYPIEGSDCSTVVWDSGYTSVASDDNIEQNFTPIPSTSNALSGAEE